MLKLTRQLPWLRRVALWLRTNKLVPGQAARFRILIADLAGDSREMVHTRHLEQALTDQSGLTILPVGAGPRLVNGEIDDAAMEQGRRLLTLHNGDVLFFGEVAAASPRIRLRMVGRYEGAPGRHGPYQMNRVDLPKRFGPDFEGQLMALVALSITSCARAKEDRAYVINLLRPAATKLTRLLENPAMRLDKEQQGALWHGLGLAASVLGELTQSRRWLEVAISAHRAALSSWEGGDIPFDWAMTQNNLGHALRLLAERIAFEAPASGQARFDCLCQSIDAFQRALNVFRSFPAPSYISQTEANLARARSLLGPRTMAAAE